MATTAFGALSNARKILWAEKISQQGRDQSFWFMNGFIGRNTDDMTRPVHRITELTRTSRGDTVVMQLVADLAGDGVVGDNLLEGNEESLVNDSQEIQIDQLRHGVKSQGALDEQRTVIRFRSTAKDKLSFWLADTLDELMFLTASGRSYTLTTEGATRGTSQLPSLEFAADVSAPTTNRLFYAGSASSTGTLTAADKMTWALITKACAFAKRARIKPIRDGGKDHYVLVLSTEQMHDLKNDNTYQTLVAKAGVRGSKNPLFNNAVAVVDGVVIHEHNKVCSTLDAVSGSAKWGTGSDVDGAQALLLGAQALGFAMIGEPKYNESDNTDYGNKKGLSFGRMFGLLKPQFKSRYDDMSREDFGVISIYTAAAAL